jgi:hypothetical protein
VDDKQADRLARCWARTAFPSSHLPAQESQQAHHERAREERRAQLAVSASLGDLPDEPQAVLVSHAGRNTPAVWVLADGLLYDVTCELVDRGDGGRDPQVRVEQRRVDPKSSNVKSTRQKREAGSVEPAEWIFTLEGGEQLTIQGVVGEPEDAFCSALAHAMGRPRPRPS